MNNNLHQLLSNWGMNQRQIPPNNTVLKTKILSLTITPRPVKSSAPVKVPWLSFALGALALVALIASPGKLQKHLAMPAIHTSDINFQNSLSESDELFFKSSTMPARPFGEIPAADNREFTKVIYSAGIKSRQILDLASRLQTTIRGFGGRIDSSNASKKNAYISFVLPAEKFESFRQELKSIAGERFVEEQLSTENYLPQKQNIEEQQKTVNQMLTDLEKQKSEATKTHEQAVASLQSQINAANKKLAQLKAQTPDNLEQELQRQEQIKQTNAQLASLKSQLAQENKNYSESILNFDSNIDSQKKVLENLSTQDKNLLENVATVRGTISLAWINLWQLITLYLPAYWISLLLVIAAVAAYFFRRRAIIIP